MRNEDRRTNKGAMTSITATKYKTHINQTKLNDPNMSSADRFNNITTISKSWDICERN